MNKDHIAMGVGALVDYLQFIGINVIGYHQQHDYDSMYSMSYSHPTLVNGVITTYIDCSSKEEQFKYVSKCSKLEEIVVTPVVNRDALYGGCFQADGQPVETVFSEDKTFKYQMIVRVSSLEDLDKWILNLKKETEPLRFKRFNEEMDKQITEELSQDT
jgi:hypothetical protein